MTACGIISANILVNCADPIFGGTETTLYLFNKADIASYEEDIDNPLLVTDITMKSGKKGFKWEGLKTSLKPYAEVVIGDFQDLYRHGAEFLVFGNEVATKLQIEKLVLGETVAIVENKQKTGDSTFEILGRAQGLKVSVLRRGSENNGAYAITIQSLDEGLEPHLLSSFAVFTTGSDPVYDYDDTAAALAAIVTA